MGSIQPRRLGVALLVACTLVPRSAPAATAAGVEIINVADCEFTSAPAGGPPSGAAPPTTVQRVQSNPVRTVVSELATLEELSLAVEPAGTVAPGTTLHYTLTLRNGPDLALSRARVELPLDSGLGAPASWTDGSVPVLGGGSLPVTGTFDSTAGRIIWDLPFLGPGQGVQLQLQIPVLPAVAPETWIAMTGSLDVGSLPSPLASNTVLTPVVAPVLAVTKQADRPAAVPGDGAVFEMTIRHGGTAPDFTSVVLVDTLPAGLRALPEGVTVDGAPTPAAANADGSVIRIPLGPVSPGAVRTVRLGVLVGPAARRGEVINRAHAEGVTAGGATVVSLPASAPLQIMPGPFRREAYLQGRVFVDRNGDGRPGRFEPGIPGALVQLADGRGAITDITGRWHVEGVRPGQHVLRVDPGTLPSGLALVAAGAEWAGDADTRFVEARASTLVLADFPVGPATTPLCRILEGQAPRLLLPAASLLDPRGLPSAAAGRHLEEAAAFLATGRRRAAPVDIHCDASARGEEEALAELRARLRRALPARTDPVTGGEPSGSSGPAAAPEPGLPPEKALDAAVRNAGPGETRILFPADGVRLVRPQTHVDVLHPAGTVPELRVNGRLVPAARIGATAVLPARGAAATRFVGVSLEAGENRLQLQSLDRAGGEAGAPAGQVRVILPGPAVALGLSVPGERWQADGATSGRLRVAAVDAGGRPAASRAIVTLLAEGARPLGRDADLHQEGFQVRLEEGEALVRFAPLVVPGRVRLAAFTAEMETEIIVPVIPAPAPWRVMGLVEGTLAGAAGVEGSGGQAPGLGDDIQGDGGRMALLVRGPVGAGAQLTVSLDTERERDRDRLFGPFEPDAFFPAPGDTAVRVDEAQSQGKLFARLDGAGGHLQWGDFATALERTELSRYDRRLTGLAGEQDWGRLSLQGFAAPTRQQVARDVLLPDGTSGPYLLSSRPVVARSETVIVEVRDRFRTEEVLSRQVKLRDLDYSLDPEAGSILFRGPVAPFDAAFNPVRVVVLYETRGGGDERVAAGGRLAWQATSQVTAGASLVREERVGDPLDLAGIDLEWRPQPATRLQAEATRTDAGAGHATAYRLGLRARPSSVLEWDLAYRDIPMEFANPTYLASPEIGTRRVSAAALWQPAAGWRLKGEVLSQQDDKIDLTRRVAGVEAERRFSAVTARGALRAVQSESPAAGDVSSTLAEAGIRGRLATRWSAELLRRQVLGSQTAPGYPTRTAAGLTYHIREDMQAFLRHEIESGDGPEQDRTLLGLEGRLGPHTRSFARYGLEQGATGSSLRATTGVETTLPLSPASSLSVSAARLQTTRGDEAPDFTTLAGGYEYRSGASLASGRYEIRFGSRDVRHLLTASAAFRPAGDWTLFVRERVSVLDPEDGGAALRGEGLMGLAYRPPGGAWRFLSRLDHTTASGRATAPGGVVPLALDPTGPPAAGLGIGSSRTAPAVAADNVSLTLAAGARLTARQRLAATFVARLAGSGATPGLPDTRTDLTSLHYTAQVRECWTVGGSLRRFEQRELDEARSGAGLEVGYLLMRNLWVTGGYNVAGFSAPGLPGADRTDRGGFISFRLKLDESNLLPWLETRMDRPGGL